MRQSELCATLWCSLGAVSLLCFHWDTHLPRGFPDIGGSSESLNSICQTPPFMSLLMHFSSLYINSKRHYSCCFVPYIHLYLPIHLLFLLLFFILCFIFPTTIMFLLSEVLPLITLFMQSSWQQIPPVFHLLQNIFILPSFLKAILLG